MKKLWFPIVIITIWLIIFVASPWFAGGKVEQRFDNLITELNTNGIFKFEKIAYKKGLLSSKASLSMSLNMETFGAAFSQLGAASEMKPLVLIGEVQHGPFLLDNGFEFAVGQINFVPEMTPEQQLEMTKLFATENPLTLFIKFNWDGSSSTTGALAGFKIPEQGIISKQAALSVNLTDAGNHLTADFNWDGLSANKPDQKMNSLTIGKVTLSSDQVQAIEDIWVGDVALGITAVEFSNMGMNGMAENFAITSESALNETKDFMQGSADFTLNQVTVNDVTYVEDLLYSVSFEHIHLASVQKLAQAIADAQQGGGSPEAMQLAMGLQLMSIIPEIVNKGFSLNINALNATVMGEEIRSNLKIDIAAGTNIKSLISDLTGINATADISISKALLDKFPAMANPQMIQTLLRQGLIIEEDGKYQAKAEFIGAQLTVNGNPVALPF